MRHSWRYRVMPVFYVVCGAWAAWRLGRRQRYDVVHVHWPVPHALFGWLIRRACGARLVTSWYGAELRLVKGPLPWLRPFVRWALGTSDQVVAISSHTAREIAAVSDVRPRVIPYTIGFTGAGAAVRPVSAARRPRGAVRRPARRAQRGAVPDRGGAAAVSRPARPSGHHR